MAKDVRRRLGDPLALASWMGIPAGIGLLLSLLGGGDVAGDQLLIAGLGPGSGIFHHRKSVGFIVPPPGQSQGNDQIGCQDAGGDFAQRAGPAPGLAA